MRLRRISRLAAWRACLSILRVIRRFTASSPEMRLFRTRTVPMCAETVTIVTTASITVATALRQTCRHRPLPSGLFSSRRSRCAALSISLTAYFLLERQLAQHGTCRVVVPVFDGSGLYNLRFTDVKRETLSADGYQNFAGPTQLCEVVREEIMANRNKNEDTYRRGRIWYARLVGGDRMMPVRMEFDTEFGVVTGYLAELRGRGVDLHLM